MNFIREFCFAAAFLTRFPVPVKIEYSKELPSRSMGYYPLVGILIGAAVLFVEFLAGLFMPFRITNVLVLAFLIIITGGIHLDGFMDTIDGLFSGRDREKKLKIMHDSRVGAFGVIALVLLLLLKFNLLLEIRGVPRLPLLLLMTSFSRGMVVFAAFKYPLASSSKLGREYKNFLSIRELLLSLIWLLLLGAGLHYYADFSYLWTIIIFLVCFINTVIISNYIRKRIGGLTGDIYGAVSEINEAAVLLFFVIFKTTLF